MALCVRSHASAVASAANRNPGMHQRPDQKVSRGPRRSFVAGSRFARWPRASSRTFSRILAERLPGAISALRSNALRASARARGPQGVPVCIRDCARKDHLDVFSNRARPRRSPSLVHETEMFAASAKSGSVERLRELVLGSACLLLVERTRGRSHAGQRREVPATVRHYLRSVPDSFHHRAPPRGLPVRRRVRVSRTRASC